MNCLKESTRLVSGIKTLFLFQETSQTHFWSLSLSLDIFKLDNFSDYAKKVIHIEPKRQL